MDQKYKAVLVSKDFTGLCCKLCICKHECLQAENSMRKEALKQTGVDCSYEKRLFYLGGNND